MSNANLGKARKNKNDEFYTQLTDIEKEVKNYRRHFKNKVVFCNCDDPDWSNFWKFFVGQFETLELKKLIATHYDPDKSTYKLEYTGKGRPKKTALKGNGDFRSDECVALMREADVVVTNPPFSLFREFVALLMKEKKKFLIIGDVNAATYRDFFPLVQKNRIWRGVTMKNGASFENDNGDLVKFGKTTWWANLPHSRRNEEVLLWCEYNSKDYPAYDNYDAIEVGKVKDIPKDYYGDMGVPITFLDKYNPNQFEIVGLCWLLLKGQKEGMFVVDGKRVYRRLVIRRKKGE